MKRWPLSQTRAEYEAIQMGRTAAKWTLNGITREEVEWIAERIPIPQSILCLGVRNGLEVDLFREVFDGKAEVRGVEIHPQGVRPDVWIGSFDAMPTAWTGRFALLYSNAFDHAYDPEATALEWRRVAQPGALIALTLPIGNEATATDPVADVTLSDIERLFDCELVDHRYVAGQPWRMIGRLP